MSFKILPPLLVFLVLLAAPASLAVTVTIQVSTDKPSYTLGEVVTISGSVTEDGTAKAGVYVNIEVTDPAGTLRYADVVKTGTDGSFSTSFKLAETLPTGTYTVKAFYGGVSEFTTFVTAKAPEFSISLSKDALVVPQGWYDSVVISVEAVGPYEYNVELSASTPDGVTAAFSTTKDVPDFKSVMVLSASMDAEKGSYEVTVTAVGEDGTVQSKSLTVFVVDTPAALTKLADISAKLDEIDMSLADIKTSLEDVKSGVSDVNTALSDVTDSLSDINDAISEVNDAISEVQTALSNLANGVNGISSDLADVRSSVDDAKAAIGGISAATYAAAILALIAAVAAIYAVVVVTRKLA
ncbi:MAG: hypothetical protein AYL29_000080 [Candidatus Bathyarchaeota archaeon B24]|nr:MAG: hypothetical protein AYL29_000080 [Candidatus Bathyarchaeota archaeon B24]RLI25468.1 MAG: hypothetical protein DRO57_03960 [Candidatus Bathyarchaeota archaeon]